jgi:TolB-like protein
MKQFLWELQRRNVFRAIAAFVVIGWVLLQVATTLEEALGLPAWFDAVVASLLAIGFPAVLILSWVYELTPEGLKKTADIPTQQSITGDTGRKLNYVTIANVAEPTSSDTSSASIVAAFPGYDDKSIAVLPFKNLSDSAENVYFSDGVMEAILNDLARIRDLKVVSRTSVEAYRDTSKSIPVIGAELDVAHVLEGSVQRSGDDVRVTAQLIATEDDRHLWSSNYDRDISDIFKIQSEIANAISRNLELILTSEEKELMANAPTADLRAYDLYLQAKGISNSKWWIESTAGDAREAIELCRRAVDLDPEFALAYACIGYNLHKFGIADYIAVDDWKESALENLNKALSLEPSLWVAHAALADIAFTSGDFTSGFYHTDKLLQYHPNHPGFLQISSIEKLRLGQYERAVDLSLRSLMLIPNGNYSEQSSLIFSNLMAMDPELFESLLLDEAMESSNEIAYEFMRAGKALTKRNYESYLAQMTRVYERTPTPNNKTNLALAHSFVLDFETARRIYEDVLSGSEGSENIFLKHPFMHRYASTLMQTGERERGLQIMRSYRDQLLDSVDSSTDLHGNKGTYYDLSLIYAALGETDQAMKWLKMANEKKREGAFFDLTFIGGDRMLDPIRDEPDFIAMLQEIQDRQEALTAIFQRRLKEQQGEGRLLWLKAAT